MSEVGRVLIADDDEAIRNLVSKVLDLAQVPHDAVRDGRAAIEKLEEHDYAVVLVDLMMPVVNGYELLDHLRDRPNRPETVLVMTAASDEDLRKLDPTVVTTIIRKPFDIHVLSILVRDAALRGAPAVPQEDEETEKRAAQGGGGDNVLPFER